jgi:signal transduction histidine kinase
VTGQDDLQHMAREGIQRVLYTAIGFAALIFGGLHAAQIMGQLGELNLYYGYVAVTVSVVMPTSLIVVARIAPSRFTHAYAKATVVLFAAAHAAWLLFMTVEHTAQTPWFQSINSIPAILAAVTWRHRWVWWYAFAQLPLVALTNYYSTGGAWRDAVLSGVLSTMFSGIVIGVGLALVAAAQTQDDVAAEARQRASVEASARTREREQARINGVVRDEVMSALVVAGREPYTARVASHAEAALSRIASLTTDDHKHGEYSPVGAIAALRSAVDEAGGRIEFWHTNVARKPIPGEVVEALSEALSEAVRNSIQHGGDEEGLVSRLVRVTMIDDVIQVRVEDSGRGFNPHTIPARRLGIRVSILKRMQSLEGGDAVIDSRPGRGTAVTLTWKRKP